MTYRNCLKLIEIAEKKENEYPRVDVEHEE